MYFLCQDSVFVCFDIGRWYLHTEIMPKIKKRIYVVLYLDFFGPQMALDYHLNALSQGPKVSISRAQPPPTCPCNGCCPHQKQYTRCHINHRCICAIIWVFLLGLLFEAAPIRVWSAVCLFASILTRGYWMVYRGTGFLAVVWFGSTPSPLARQ